MGQRYCSLSPLVNVRVLQIHRADVLQSRPEQYVVVQLFQYLCRPTRDTAHREYRYEEIIWYVEQVVDRT